MDYQIKTLSQLRPVLQGFRKQAGLTQAAVASQLGITQQSYAQIEANPALTSVERLFKVMRLLNVQWTFADEDGASKTAQLAQSTLPPSPAITTPASSAGTRPQSKRNRATAPASIRPPDEKKEDW